MSRWLAHKKTFCLITGASRGLGRVLAFEFAPYFSKNSVLLLLARNEGGLQDVKNDLLIKNPDVKVVVYSLDLGCKIDSAAIQKIVNGSLKESESKCSDFEQAVIIHNAGTVGRSACTEEMNDPYEWANYFDVNVISPACLNSVFLKTFSSNVCKERLVINITSLAAVSPIPSAGLYNTGKAAREAFFRTLAAENTTVKVLNYSPGPLDTEMFHDICKNIVHPKGKEMFKATVEADRVLSCETTTKRLLSILEKDTFASGDRIDYYDF